MEVLSGLLFSLLGELSEPLLAEALVAARALILAAAPRADALGDACCARLRGAVCVLAPSERKQQLLLWMHELRCEAERAFSKSTPVKSLPSQNPSRKWTL